MKKLRTPIVSVLGHVDHGKCLIPESIVATALGLFKIEELFNSAKPFYKENGCEIRELFADVQSFSGEAKSETLRATHVWKLRHRGKIIRVKLKNWHTISVTPEHPFLTNSGWKKACELKEGDYVAIPKILLGNSSFERFLDFVRSKTVYPVPQTLEEWKSIFYSAGNFLRTHPETILFAAPNDLLSEFIRGYFDSRAIISECGIEVSNDSEEFTKALSLLLLRFGIISKINGRSLIISGKRNLEMLLSIGAAAKALLRKLIENSEEDERYPIQMELKRLRILFGFTKAEMAEHIPSYEKYEGKELPSYDVIRKFIEVLQKGCEDLDRKVAVLKGELHDERCIKAFIEDGLICEGGLTELGKEALEIWEKREFDGQIEYISNLIENIAFIEVAEIKEEDYDGYVYDLTTHTHNFVANGVIVHNTTLLDKIRKSRVTAKEAGGITQHIGATEVPISVIKEICKDIWKANVTIPGLLFIDTPGHKAFTNLRRRGGALADLAILIIDINEGFKPQTEEALMILKTFKTPFVVAANKIDKIPGWQSHEDTPFTKSYAMQEDVARKRLDNKIYELIGEFYTRGFSADRFDRIRDFTRTVAIVPISALTGEGVAELLMILVGLAQRYLEKTLRLHVEGKAKGTVLEVKEEKGLGLTFDAILYDGTLRVGDSIVIGGINGVIQTHVKALLRPRPVREMRLESKFKSVESVTAAAGIKIVAPNIEGVLAGSEFEAVESEEDVKKFEERIRKEYQEIAIKTDEEGIVIKADTLGSLEALINEFKELGIPIKKADVGDITRKDVIEASANRDELNRVIVGFNVKPLPGVEEEAAKYNVRMFIDRIIYNLIDNLTLWRDEEKRIRERQKIESIIMPAKIQLLKDFIFRRSKPAVIGIRVLAGELRKDVRLIKPDGSVAGTVRSMQKSGENISVAKEGDEIAIAIDGVTIGRQLTGNEVLYVDVPERHAKVIERELFESLSEEAKKAFMEFLEIKRRENPFWGK